MMVGMETGTGAGADAGGAAPFFSVVIPTRDRPVLFRAALESVLRQEGASFEVVVINDGSTAAFADAYATIERELGREAGHPVTYVHLEHLARGHGQSFALNTGARHAAGRFLCFLDDDDCWVDGGHLRRARGILGEKGNEAAELLLFDQVAYRGQERVTDPIWLEDLGRRLKAAGPAVDGGAWAVTPEQLLTAVGFAHVNATVVAAALFRRVGGFNEGLFYECDRDFYLRAVDAAAAVLYCPEAVARHNIPDPAKGASMSTRARPLEKHMCQFILLNHALHTARHPAIRRHARAHRRFALGKALRAAGSGRDYVRIGSIMARSMAHEAGNRLRGARTLPAGPHGV